MCAGTPISWMTSVTTLSSEGSGSAAASCVPAPPVRWRGRAVWRMRYTSSGGSNGFCMKYVVPSSAHSINT